jgi:hypothetical protein
MIFVRRQRVDAKLGDISIGVRPMPAISPAADHENGQNVCAESIDGSAVGLVVAIAWLSMMCQPLAPKMEIASRRPSGDQTGKFRALERRDALETTAVGPNRPPHTCRCGRNRTRCVARQATRPVRDRGTHRRSADGTGCRRSARRAGLPADSFRCTLRKSVRSTPLGLCVSRCNVYRARRKDSRGPPARELART